MRLAAWALAAVGGVMFEAAALVGGTGLTEWLLVHGVVAIGGALVIAIIQIEEL